MTFEVVSLKSFCLRLITVSLPFFVKPIKPLTVIASRDGLGALMGVSEWYIPFSWSFTVMDTDASTVQTTNACLNFVWLAAKWMNEWARTVLKLGAWWLGGEALPGLPGRLPPFNFHPLASQSESNWLADWLTDSVSEWLWLRKSANEGTKFKFEKRGNFTQSS